MQYIVDSLSFVILANRAVRWDWLIVFAICSHVHQSPFCSGGLYFVVNHLTIHSIAAWGYIVKHYF